MCVHSNMLNYLSYTSQPSHQTTILTQGVGDAIRDRGTFIPKTTDDYLDAVVRGFYHRKGSRVILLIFRHIHFVCRRQIDPKLKATHQTILLLWHLGMNDTTTGFHPLSATRTKITGITHAVLMLHMTIDHISKSTEAAVGMRGEARNILIRIITTEMIQ